MRAEDFRESVALGATQLRKLLCHMRYRAVVLANLDAVGRAVHLVDGRCVASFCQRRRHAPCSRFNVIGAVRYSRKDLVDAAARERRDRLVAPDFTELTNRRCGKVVICVPELGASGGSQLVSLGWPAASLLLPGSGGVGLGVTGRKQSIEVSADTRRRDSEMLTYIAGGDRSGLQQQLDDLATRVAVRFRSDFHNTIVTELPDTI
jgi:hypothetical protein